MKTQSKLSTPLIKGALSALALLGAMASATAADFSYTGSLLVGRQVQYFDFTLAAPASVSIRTYHFSGGTNAAGTIIPAGGFDPQLFLFDRTTGNQLFNDDDFFAPRDSGLNSGGVNSVPLLAGNYRLALTKFNNDPAAPGNLSSGFNANTSDGFGDRTKNYAVDIRNVTSSTVVAPVTQTNLACAFSTIAALPANQVFGSAQRNILLGLVRTSSTYLGTVYRSLSTTALQSAITRTNGCGERGSPDSIQRGGNEEDFVTTCPAQDAVLACLRAPLP